LLPPCRASWASSIGKIDPVLLSFFLRIFFLGGDSFWWYFLTYFLMVIYDGTFRWYLTINIQSCFNFVSFGSKYFQSC
jgi:hypothetical protein